jgi:hypothetical protein
MFDAPHVVEDPRADDFPGDSAIWLAMLNVAAFDQKAANPQAYEVLHGIRASGALAERIPSKVLKSGSIRISPRYSPVVLPDPDETELRGITRGPTQWATDREWEREKVASLQPNVDAIREIVKAAAAVLDTPLH